MSFQPHKNRSYEFIPVAVNPSECTELAEKKRKGKFQQNMMMCMKPSFHTFFTWKELCMVHISINYYTVKIKGERNLRR